MTTTDVIVIGSGPVGLDAAAALQAAGRTVLVLEARDLASSIFDWPPGTRFLSAPERVAIAGVPLQAIDQQPVTRETYLAYLRTVVELHRLEIRYDARVRRLDVQRDHVVVTTEDDRTWRAEHVVLATGRLSRPRRLEVPGADAPFVHDRMHDPHVYFGRHVLIVGAGNGGLGAACRLWRSGAHVTITHRNEDFDADTLRAEVLADTRMLIEKSCIQCIPGADVVEVKGSVVVLRDRNDQTTTTIETDRVLVQIGYEPDVAWMHESGVTSNDGVPTVDPDTMRTSLDRVHAIGTLVEDTNRTTSISHARRHVVRLVHHLTGRDATIGGAPHRLYPFEFGDDQPDTPPTDET